MGFRPPALFFLMVVSGCSFLKAQSHDLLNLPGGSGSDPRDLSAFLEKLGVRSFASNSRLMDELLEKGTNFLNSLPPEQKENLEKLAREYLRRNSPGADKDLEGSLSQMLEELKRFEGSGEALPESLAPFGEKFDEIARSFADKQRDKRSPPGESAPGNKESKDRPRGNGSGKKNDRSSADPENNNPQPEQVDPDTANRGGQPDSGIKDRGGNNPGEKNGKNNGSNPSNKGKDERRNDSGEEESVGTRFDRMIMDAIENGISDRESNKGDGIAGSIDSFLDAIVRNIEKAHDRRRQFEGENRQNDFWNKNRKGDFGNNGQGNSLFSGDNLGSMLAAPFRWLGHWRWLGILAAGILLYWLFRKLAAMDLGERITGHDRPRYRHAQLRSARQLVESVDRFLLARFGRGADWWTVRKAQAELQNQELRRVSDSRLDELASAYERARYSPNDATLDASLLQNASETLKDLALDLSLSQKPASAALSGESP